jgi:hypothetical protein
MANIIKIYGYPTCGFVCEPAKDSFGCPLCLQVLANPFQCFEGHAFCLSCITKAYLTRQCCPVCVRKMSLDKYSPNRLIKDIIESFDVRCNVPEEIGNRDEDDTCSWIGRPSERQHHIENCVFRRPVLCPNKLGGGCLSTCSGQHASQTALRVHLVKYTAESPAYIGRLIKDTKRLKESLPLNCTLGLFVANYHRSTRSVLDVYCGAIDADGNKDGIGVESFEDKSSYRGDFVNGKRHGFGHLIDYDGYVYVGKFENNERNGECLKFSMICGRHGSGTFVDGQLHGKGRYSNTFDKESYEGDFVGGLPEGIGKKILPCGLVSYEGSFVSGRMEGKGIMTWLDTMEKLNGMFVDNLCNGKAILFFACGKIRYQGEFANGEFNGLGTWHEDGGVYTGNFVNGSKHGNGLLLWENGDTFDGEFKNDLIDGKGILTLSVEGFARDVLFIAGTLQN